MIWTTTRYTRTAAHAIGVGCARTFSARCKRPLLSAIAIVCLTLASLPATASATILAFGLNTEFSGAVAPSGAPPWVVITLDDLGGTGSVDMTITAPGLTGDENVARLLMNLDPLLDPTSLLFTFNSKSRAAMTTPTILKGVNAFMADGDGKYDITLDFATGGPPDTFVVGDSINYTISGIATLTANSFDFLSAPAGGHGPFKMAAHVQNTGPLGEDSGWITGPDPFIVPEPSSLALLALGFFAVVGAKARRLLVRRR